jgi:hypothetical protein
MNFFNFAYNHVAKTEANIPHAQVTLADFGYQG